MKKLSLSCPLPSILGPSLRDILGEAIATALIRGPPSPKMVLTRKQKLEEERNYELVTRKRKETGTFCKSFLRFTFSQVGLVLVVILVAVGGKSGRADDHEPL